MNPHTYAQGCLGGLVLACRVCGPKANEIVKLPLAVQAAAAAGAAFDAKHDHPADAPAFDAKARRT